MLECKGGVVMYAFTYYQVRDVMTSGPITVDKQVTISDVEAIFEKHDFNGIPVVDESNQLIGMITKLDLLKAFAFTKTVKTPHYDTIMVQPISQVMSLKPYIFFPESPLTRVLQKMIKTGHKSFPVVEDECVVGIIAREDILCALRQGAQGQLPARLVSSDMEDAIEAKTSMKAAER
jgi:CBS domain-containing protein